VSVSLTLPMKILLYTDLFVYNSFDPGLFFFRLARLGARRFPCTPDSFLYREPGSFQFALIKHRVRLWRELLFPGKNRWV